jgi:phenylalanyl-tRNA synthetase beta subunit
LTLHSDDATLTEAQIEAAVHTVVAQLGQDVGARQRV